MSRGTVSHETGGALIRRSRQGDLAAFEALYDSYRGQVFRTALAITRDRAAAEDILQECFIRLHRCLDSLDESQSLAPWLYRVTVNLCYSWVARQRRWLHPLEEALEWLGTLPQPSPVQLVERQEVRAAIEQAIGGLGMDQRVTLVLYYLNGLSVGEIATVMRCPQGTVKSRLHYGRKNVRRRLVSEGRVFQEMVYELSL
ncbi:MAG: RNA polymerase sigma factor [Anaerolineae bacterium]|nr:RNA polymerase sigma factor [Anaerolineae bacterium]